MALERQQKALQKFMLLLLSSLVLQQHFFKARIWVIRIRDTYFFIGFKTEKIHLEFSLN